MSMVPRCYKHSCAFITAHKGASIYYVITLGGVGGPDTNDDIDDALRGGGGGNHQNDDAIY